MFGEHKSVDDIRSGGVCKINMAVQHKLCNLIIFLGGQESFFCIWRMNLFKLLQFLKIYEWRFFWFFPTTSVHK